MGEEMISVQTADFNGSPTQCVSAKNLYEFLGLSKKNFAWWLVQSTSGNEYAIEWEDYIMMTEGVGVKDATLTIDYAKRLAMKSGGSKWEEVRNYFLNIEKAYKKVITPGPQVPQTYLEALQAQVETVKKLEAQWLLLETATRTIDKLTHVGKLYTATEIAKELGLRSATELNIALEKKSIQYKLNGTWVLRSWFADKGYTSIKQMELENGKVIYDRKWTQLGREFLINKFNSEEPKMIEKQL